MARSIPRPRLGFAGAACDDARRHDRSSQAHQVAAGAWGGAAGLADRRPPEIPPRACGGPRRFDGSGRTATSGYGRPPEAGCRQADRQVARRRNAARSDVRDFVGETHAEEFQDAVGHLLPQPTRLGKLRQFLLQQPGGAHAAKSLKRAALDHMLEKVSTQTEVGSKGVKSLKPGATQAFIAQNKAAMTAARFLPQQIQMMDRVADDIERSQSLTSTTIPRGSSSASKTIAALHKIGEGAHHGSGCWRRWLSLRRRVNLFRTPSEPLDHRRWCCWFRRQEADLRQASQKRRRESRRSPTTH